MREIVVTSLSLLAACSLSKPSPGSSARADGTAAPVVSVPPPIDSARRLKLGLALFVDEKVEICFDNDLIFTDAAGAKDMADTFRKIGGDEKRAQLFPDGCAQAFKDRVVLGTCVEDFNGKAKGTSSTRYYLIESMHDDRAMRECLKKGGKWSALAHDTVEYRKADAEAKLRALDKQLGK